MSPSRARLMVAGLLALGVVSAIGGVLRLQSLGAGVPLTAENARFVAAPVPVVLHIGGALLFSLLGAFQFLPQLRNRSRWHRRAGWLSFIGGAVTAVSGIQMTLTYPWPPGDGAAVYVSRLVFGTAMVVSLALSIVFAVRRDIGRHRAWSARAYAIGMGAGTQVLTHLPLVVFLGDLKPGVTARALAMLAGWVINVGVVEWALWRSGRQKLSDRREQGLFRSAAQTGKQYLYGPLALGQ